MTNAKVGDIIWINEVSANGDMLHHDWYGQIVEIQGCFANIKDTMKNSPYKGCISKRRIMHLEKK